MMRNRYVTLSFETNATDQLLQDLIGHLEASLNIPFGSVVITVGG